MKGKQAHILIVEDNPGDVDLIRYSFKKNKIMNTFDVAEDGEEGLNYIFKRNGHEDALTPDLIILDINLPKVNGLTVLKEIKNDPNTKKIPVIILTTSKDDMDVLKAYDSYVNAYLVKPVDMKKFLEVVSSLEIFWLSIVQLPDLSK